MLTPVRPYAFNEIPVNIDAVAGSETDVLHLEAGLRYILDSLKIKCADPGANQVVVRLYELINGILTEIEAVNITSSNYTTYFKLMDLWGVPFISGDNIQITVEASAGGPYAVTGSYAYRGY